VLPSRLCRPPCCSGLETALSFPEFNPVYLRAKQYTCCQLLNFLGDLWLGLLVVGCCGLPLTLATFWWLGRLDKLEPRGCVLLRCILLLRSAVALLLLHAAVALCGHVLVAGPCGQAGATGVRCIALRCCILVLHSAEGACCIVPSTPVAF